MSVMKALHRIEFPQLKDLTAIQKSFNAANQRLLNTNFQMIQDDSIEKSEFIDSILDYVTDKGLSGTWFFREWANGTLEAWGQTASDTAAITTAAGSLYKAEYAITLPEIFAHVDCLTVNAVSTTPLMSNIKSYDTTTVTMHLLSATSTTATLTFFVHIIGRV